MRSPNLLVEGAKRSVEVMVGVASHADPSTIRMASTPLETTRKQLKMRWGWSECIRTR